MRFMIFFLFLATLTGCASQTVPKHPPMAHGKWQPINEAGFIPPDVTIYKRLPVLQDELKGADDVPIYQPNVSEYPDAQTAVVDIYKSEE